uniref:Amino acid permease n=1 Tax=Candidatus Methanomethylicus mesodigestus TaxID=1867258 RepID=A0A7C3J4X4_9CREN
MALKRSLSLIDATSVGIGAIIGAGIYVVLGLGIGLAGPSIVASIAISGAVALFSAFSFAELGSAIPKEGGPYAFAYELFSPFYGFIVGCLWLFAQIVSGVAISIGLASYVVLFIPSLPVKVVAVAAAALLTSLNLVGIKQSAAVNNALVLIKVAILCAFIAFGALYVNMENFADFAPNGIYGTLQGAGIIFFAYLGYGRISTLGEEVKNPERNLPLSIMLALGISMVIYILTGTVAAGLMGYQDLAQSGSPLADAASATGSVPLVIAVSMGAIVATTSVLLTNLIGISRVAFAMARKGQLPKSISKVSPKRGVPYVSIVLMGSLLIALTGLLDLRQATSITNVSLLIVHMTVNASAIMLRRKAPQLLKFRAPLFPLIPALGICSCLALALTLGAQAWLAGGAVVLISGAAYLAAKSRGKKPLT